jgi:hypothetical protein
MQHVARATAFGMRADPKSRWGFYRDFKRATMLADRLRALQMPVLVMTIVASLWATARTREMEQDATRPLPAPKAFKQIIKNNAGPVAVTDSYDDDR